MTGAFSVAHQAMSLGYLPRLRIVHTSAKAMGQIYVPAINWLLLASVLTLVLTFKSSVALAFAYGTGVTATITITTLLFLYVAARRWSVPRWLVIVGGGTLLSIEVLFLAANLTKIGHGAWLPLLIGLVAFTVMTTWQKGRAIVAQRREHEEGSLRTFIDELHTRELPVERVPGTAVFLNRTKVTTPLAMREIVEHLHALSEHVVILSIEVLPVPHVPPEERLVIDDLGYTDDGISHVGARFGYMDRAEGPGGAGPDRPGRARVLDRRGRHVLLPLGGRPRPRRRAGVQPVAQGPVPGDVAPLVRRRGVLPPAAREDRDRRLADRGLDPGALQRVGEVLRQRRRQLAAARR